MAMTEEAKSQVNQCEKEIATIKASIKALGPASETEESKNSLTVALLKTAGLPESADLSIKLQLTSPIEEAVLSSKDASSTFQAVELGQAMLSMTALDKDIPLGSAESIDLASLIKLDAMSGTQEYAVEKELGFRASGEDSTAEPVFHATLKISFRPSPKDQREELYEMLNKASTKKAQAVEQLRRSALAASRQAVTRNAEGQNSPAVKAGFLNKAKKEESAIQAFYDKWLGPRSMIRQIIPVAKNYIIFFGVVALFHYKGDALALPPPV